MSSMGQRQYEATLKNLFSHHDADHPESADERVKEAEERNTRLQEIYRGVMGTNQKLLQMNEQQMAKIRELEQQLEEAKAAPIGAPRQDDGVRR
jgi:hypothetical protein